MQELSEARREGSTTGKPPVKSGELRSWLHSDERKGARYFTRVVATSTHPL